MQATRRSLAAHTGMLPDYLIIGGQKCGTTSLYHYLTAHPDIRPATVREIGFFNTYERFSKGLAWYRSHFPSTVEELYRRLVHRRRSLTGEADASYSISPHALRRISRILPQVRLILILRNPVDRAYSHYQHSRRIGSELLSFEEALAREEERVGAAWRRMQADEYFYCRELEYFTYLHRGIYIEQVEMLFRLFPQTQILILQSEELSLQPARTYERVLEFLRVRHWLPQNFPRHNVGHYPGMDEATRRQLVEYFRPHNERLYAYLNRTFEWDR